MSDEPKWPVAPMGAKDAYEHRNMPGSPVQGLGPYAQMQVVNAINVAVLCDIVRHVGGRIVLEPGFAERVGKHNLTVSTKFLDDGSYEVKLYEMPPELNHPGIGTRWVRPGRGHGGVEVEELWEVIELTTDTPGFPNVTLQRLHELTGEPLLSKPVIRVEENRIRRGVQGWARWSPPPDMIEQLGGGRG